MSEIKIETAARDDGWEFQATLLRAGLVTSNPLKRTGLSSGHELQIVVPDFQPNKRTGLSSGHELQIVVLDF
ncbi:MAG: hypothetical protein HY314_03330 [Acidobacteria bacterium]|nr:hypothetical protein [Acidobacteriota bacterium]